LGHSCVRLVTVVLFYFPCVWVARAEKYHSDSPLRFF